MFQKIMKRIKQLIEKLLRNDGITLIELLIVITIIAVLGGLVVPRLLDLPQKARVTTAKNNIKTFETLLTYYSTTEGRYPTSEEGLQKLVETGKIKQKDLKDPWGNPYVYRSPGENPNNEFEIICYGADGKPGGEGLDADINSWE